MSDHHRPDDRLWESGFEGHRRAQMLRLARLPLAEKLRWMEEAHRLIRRIQAGRPSLHAGPQVGGVRQDPDLPLG